MCRLRGTFCTGTHSHPHARVVLHTCLMRVLRVCARRYMAMGPPVADNAGPAWKNSPAAPKSPFLGGANNSWTIIIIDVLVLHALYTYMHQCESLGESADRKPTWVCGRLRLRLPL